MDQDTQQNSENTSRINYTLAIACILVGSVILLIFLFLFSGDSIKERESAIVTPTPTEIPSITRLPTALTTSMPTVLPTAVVPILSTTPKTERVPAVWKEFTAVDPDTDVHTTVSLPQDYVFRFTGSEFVILDIPNLRENWDYVTSITWDEDGEIKNMYDGSLSISDWYPAFGKRIFSYLEIGTIEAKPLNNSLYYTVKIKMLSGETSYQYLYLLNGIVHIFTPVTPDAVSTNAVVASNIESILLSLQSYSKYFNVY